MQLQGGYARFVGEHLQLGIAPGGGMYVGPGQDGYQSTVTGLANVVAGQGTWRAYAGASVSTMSSTNAPRYSTRALQLGGLHFTGPSSALRLELRTSRVSTITEHTEHDALLAFEPYIGAPPAGPATSPRLGSMDVAGSLFATFDDFPIRSARLRIAPFLGVRHYLSRGLALDALVQWQHHNPVVYDSGSYQTPDESFLSLRMVTTVGMPGRGQAPP